MDWQNLMETTLGTPFCHGNDVRVLKNGDAIFPAMLEALESAQISIDFETFVYWQGEIARKFARLLASKAREGVRVNVLLDAVGSMPMDNHLLTLMEDAGVNVHRFRPIASWKIWQWDNRTHRKLLFIDSRIAFTGGVGIADEWQGNASGPSQWRDTHFLITGPVVRLMYSGFLSNWIEADDSPAPYLPEPCLNHETGQVSLCPVRATASAVWSDMALLFRVLISRVNHSLMIATAYFVPDDVMTDLLCKAAQRGVAIDILVPGDNTDSELSRLSGSDQFDRLLQHGINIYRYRPSMMHQKLLIADGELAMVGSANMNYRSISKDDEFSLLIQHPATIGTLASDFREDIEKSEPLDLKTWRDRPWWRQALEILVRRFRQQL